MKSDFCITSVKEAKRNHKTNCYYTSLPIEKGDLYFEYRGVFEGEFGYMKCHAIAKEAWGREFDEVPLRMSALDFWTDTLNWFLRRIGLEEEERRECLQEARRWAHSQLRTDSGRPPGLKGTNVKRNWCFICAETEYDPLGVFWCDECWTCKNCCARHEDT